MHEFSKFSLDVTPSWGVIAQIKKQIRVSLRENEQALIDRIEIIASELLENAIKYGIENDKSPQVSFEFKVAHDKVFISVKNGTTSRDFLEDFIRIMAEIKSSQSPHELYINRLKMLMNHPEDSTSRIGLYRIANQKDILHFDYTISDETLEVTIEVNRT